MDVFPPQAKNPSRAGLKVPLLVTELKIVPPTVPRRVWGAGGDPGGPVGSSCATAALEHLWSPSSLSFGAECPPAQRKEQTQLGFLLKQRRVLVPAPQDTNPCPIPSLLPRSTFLQLAALAQSERLKEP